MVIKSRLLLALEESKKSQADISRDVGISTAAVSLWFKDDGKTKINIKHGNLTATAKCLGVSVDWLTGRSSVKHGISNIGLVSDDAGEYGVGIPQYSVEMSAGSGNYVSEVVDPEDYVTFKRAWLARKGYTIENLCVVYVSGDSMEPRIHSGDVVLVNREKKGLIDGKIYALNYAGLARLKRIVRKANGNIVLVSDNDPDGARREEITPDTFDQLNLIGEAVWIGGDLS